MHAGKFFARKAAWSKFHTDRATPKTLRSCYKEICQSESKRLIQHFARITPMVIATTLKTHGACVVFSLSSK